MYLVKTLLVLKCNVWSVATIEQEGYKNEWGCVGHIDPGANLTANFIIPWQKTCNEATDYKRC